MLQLQSTADDGEGLEYGDKYLAGAGSAAADDNVSNSSADGAAKEDDEFRLGETASLAGSVAGRESQYSTTSEGSTASSTRVPAKPFASWANFRLFVLNSLYIHMTVLLAVPVAFLVGFAADSIRTSVVSINFGTTQRDAIEGISECTRALSNERIAVTSITIAKQSIRDSLASPSILPGLRAELYTARNSTDAVCRGLAMELKQRVDAVGEHPLAVVTTQMLKLYELRARIDAEALSNSDMFDAYSDTNDVIAGLIAVWAHDVRATLFQQQLLQLMLSRQAQNYMSSIQGTGREMLSLLSPPSTSLEHQFLVASRRFDVFDEMLRTIADTKNREVMAQWEGDSVTSAWRGLRYRLLKEPRSNWSTIDPAVWKSAFTAITSVRRAYDSALLNAATDGAFPRQDVILKAVLLSFAVLMCTVASMLVFHRRHHIQVRITAELEQSAALNLAVARFVPSNQLRVMGVRSITEVSGGNFVEVAQTLLFSSIYSFANITASKPNDELFHWLQEYFDSMAKVVARNRGFIDKFVGDSLFAVFSHPPDAVQCSVDMHSAADQLNAVMSSRRECDLLYVGIGVHHGLVCSGVFGDKRRLTCTLVSSDVNIAARLEGATKALGARTVVSGAAIQHCQPDAFEARYCGEVLVVGCDEAISAYEIFQSDEQSVKSYKNRTRDMFEEALRTRRETPAKSITVLEAILVEAMTLGIDDKALTLQLKVLKEGRIIERLKKELM